ncbi:MAG: hypothetical protein RSD49_06075 [Hafnia sp.]
MPKSLNTHIDADIACEEDEKLGPAKDEIDSLTAENSSLVFDMTEITKVNQVVCKSFSD